MLLLLPNPDDPLDVNIADMWKHDPERAHNTAREYTKKYAFTGNKRFYTPHE